MLVTRENLMTGKVNQLEIPNLTPEQYENYMNSDRMIQQELSHLTADEREFILSGLLPGEFEEHFKEE